MLLIIIFIYVKFFYSQEKQKFHDRHSPFHNKLPYPTFSFPFNNGS